MSSRTLPGRAASLCLAIAFAAISGCNSFGEKPSLAAWAAGDMVALTDRAERPDDPSVFDAEQGLVSLFAAANETVSIQLVVDCGQVGAEGLTVSFTDLLGPGGRKIAAANIKAFRMVPIPVREYPPWYLRLVERVPAPCGVYDPLVPIDAPRAGQPFRLEANRRLALWVDVHVPRDTAPGTYSGGVLVSAETHEPWAAKLNLEVAAFVLPDARPVPALGGFDHRQLCRALLRRNGKPFDPVYLDRKNPFVQRGLALVRELMRLAHAHRLDLFDKAITPLLKRENATRFRLVWDDYDAIVAPYLDGTAFDDRIGCPAWPSPFRQDWPNPVHYGGASSEVYAKAVDGLIATCREHFTQDLPAGEKVFLWPCRGPVRAEAYALHARLASLIRRADPNTPILCQLPAAPPRETGWQPPPGFAESMDIAAPSCALLDLSKAAGAAGPEHPLKGVWLSPAPPPYFPGLGVIATPADVRAAPWFAMKYQCTGLFLPEVLHWEGDPLLPAAGTETRLFYPGTIAGTDGLLPSVRLKRLRRGLQDIAYLWILQRRQRPGVARAAINGLVRYAGLAAAGDSYLDPRLDGWAKDGSTWTLARKILSHEVEAVVSPERADRTRTLAHRLDWKRFDEQTRTLRVERVRSVVASAGGDGSSLDRLKITALLEIFNEYGGAVNVQARFAKLPAGFQSPAGPVRVGSVAPARREVIRLTAEGPGPLTTDAGGKAPFPVELTTDRDEPRQLVVPVPFLVVGWTRTPPKIDGLLKDWPLRAGNTAGGFRLIGRRGRVGDGLAGRGTMIFALRDEDNLYLAFRCDEPRPDRMVARPTNFVRYEQLVICGEDVVEVLLDPGGKAKAPAEIYHAIIKPNGVLITERGVRTDPPLGPSQPWPARATLAVGAQKGVWTVELAIPLAAFGPNAAPGFWRVNFTRYATQGAEASSWSGTPRNFYDPRNLGTMFVGEAPQSADRQPKR
jgi:hypothetical protein